MTDDLQRFRAAYANPGDPCDVPRCGKPIDGTRTITFFSREPLRVIVRLCPAHLQVPYGELLALLPNLATLDTAGGPAAYIGPDAKESGHG